MATYKHLRSSTANKRPTTSIADGQLAINTNTASPGLFFKDSAGTGIVKVGPVHVGTTAPNSVPASGGSTGNYLGEQWLDTSVSPAQMKVWNGSAWIGVVADELPVSKLQDGTAGQIVQTDSAGTGVEWSSTANLPAGSESVPAYRFQGDANTGIYSPGADQLAISTGGTEAVRIDSSGRLLVGTSTGTATLQVAGTFRAGDSADGGNGGNNVTQLAATPPAGALMAEIMCVGNYYDGIANTHTGFYSAYWSSFTNTITVIKDVNHSAGSNQGFEAIWSGTQVVVRNKTGMSAGQGGRAFIRWIA